jgi:multidrug efflux pump subunit AcrB
MVYHILDIAKSRGIGKDSIIEGAVSRLRPVTMTTATTFLGLLPTGYAVGGFDPFISPMCLALAWGLVVGTVVVLFLVPVLFLIGQDLSFAPRSYS